MTTYLPGERPYFNLSPTTIENRLQVAETENEQLRKYLKHVVVMNGFSLTDMWLTEVNQYLATTEKGGLKWQ